MPDLRIAEFRIWPVRWIDQDAAIGIEQSWVDFGKDFQTSPVLEIEPGSAISQRIGGPVVARLQSAENLLRARPALESSASATRNLQSTEKWSPFDVMSVSLVDGQSLPAAVVG